MPVSPLRSDDICAPRQLFCRECVGMCVCVCVISNGGLCARVGLVL